MWKKISGILQAAFVIPFTAGIVKERRNAGYALHDGSISGIVLLTTVVICIFEMILILSNRYSRLLIVGLACLAIISLLLVSFLAKFHRHWTRHRSVKPVDHIKMKFLWFFCIGNIFYQLLQLIMHQVCHIRNNEIMLFWLSTWTFQIIQTVFIHYFSKYKFANVLFLYYGLLILFVTNISMWTQQTVYTFYAPLPVVNDTVHSNSTSSPCPSGEWIKKTVIFLNPFLEPFLLEYSLLSLIFLSEMWPKKNRDIIYVHIEDPTAGPEENSVYDHLIHQDSHSNEQLRNPWNKNAITVAVVGIVYSTSFSIIMCIYIYIPSTHGEQYTMFLYTVFFCANFVRTPIIVKCFHAMSGQLRPKPEKARNISLNQVIIIVSSCVTCGYYFLELHRESQHSTAFYMINSIFRNIATIMQTLFILQMKHYRKTGPQTHFTSIQNTFLFVSLVNLGIWVSYTFVNPRFAKHSSHSFWNNLWFPFVIFYHFESFIAFYRFFSSVALLT